MKKFVLWVVVPGIVLLAPSLIDVGVESKVPRYLLSNLPGLLVGLW